jgi:hypothetical protein
MELVADEVRRIPLTRSYDDVGASTGYGFGEPTNYHDHSGVRADESIEHFDVAIVLVDYWNASFGACRPASEFAGVTGIADLVAFWSTGPRPIDGRSTHRLTPDPGPGPMRQDDVVWTPESRLRR